jgi:hypothetical protein
MAASFIARRGGVEEGRAGEGDGRGRGFIWRGSSLWSARCRHSWENKAWLRCERRVPNPTQRYASPTRCGLCATDWACSQTLQPVQAAAWHAQNDHRPSPCWWRQPWRFSPQFACPAAQAHASCPATTTMPSPFGASASWLRTKPYARGMIGLLKFCSGIVPACENAGADSPVVALHCAVLRPAARPILQR